MSYLVAVTVLWAFSFSLIGVYLAGQVDDYFAVLTRITLAFAVFAPMLRPHATGRGPALGLMAVGAVQIGLMYLFFYQSFLFVSVPEVLLFSILTPVYITLLDDLLAGRFAPRYLLVALLAVAGAGVIRYTDVGENVWLGFALMQGANLCFAIGQVGYRRLAPRLSAAVPLHRQFGWFFAGAWPVAALGFALFGDRSALPDTPVEWGVLLWLGIAASGAGYYAWNRGVAMVDAGTLAVMNNALIPAGLVVNLLIWNRDADLLRLAIGAAIIGGALAVNAGWARRPVPR
ncbi:EamA family transporter [Salinisphaera sp. RV14]|uniref:EamA family transporter n=1 Tax=Salinisphaera sp. RV14 TaxID=3454140 RepID=UPI003F869C58